MDLLLSNDRKQLFRWALWLAIGTIVYNFAEGIISIFFGLKDETLALFGFGSDSFIETISALGVWQMILRIREKPHSERGPFEVRALRITGWCFYALAVILTVSAFYNIYSGANPESTVSGIIISLISIGTMWLLIRAKISVGRQLDSAPIVADARCNQVCLYMSIVLLIASGAWHIFHIPYVDALGTLAIVYFCITEGKESLEKAQGIATACGCE